MPGSTQQSQRDPIKDAFEQHVKEFKDFASQLEKGFKEVGRDLREVFRDSVEIARDVFEEVSEGLSRESFEKCSREFRDAFRDFEESFQKKKSEPREAAKSSPSEESGAHNNTEERKGSNVFEDLFNEFFETEIFGRKVQTTPPSQETQAGAESETKYAHKGELDPFIRSQIERAASMYGITLEASNALVEVLPELRRSAEYIEIWTKWKSNSMRPEEPLLMLELTPVEDLEQLLDRQGITLRTSQVSLAAEITSLYGAAQKKNLPTRIQRDIESLYRSLQHEERVMQSTVGTDKVHSFLSQVLLYCNPEK